MSILPEVEKRSGEAVALHRIVPRVFPRAFQPATTVEHQNAKWQKPLGKIRVKHRGGGWRKEILSENTLTALCKLPLRRRIGNQCSEYRRAQTSAANAAD